MIIAYQENEWYNVNNTNRHPTQNSNTNNPNKSHHERSHTMSTLKNGEFGIDLDKERILWTDRKRHTIFSLPLSFTKYALTETKLIIQRGCFNISVVSRTRVMSRKRFLRPSRLAEKPMVSALRKSSGNMVASPSLTRMVCRLNLATNILMTNTSPYRFSSVRTIFLFTKKFKIRSGRIHEV